MTQINIPVKKHIKKYLENKYGTDHKISKKTFIGFFLSEMLEKKLEKSNPFPGDVYTVTVPEFYFNKKGYTINAGKLRTIGLAFESLFDHDFVHYVDNRLREGETNAYKCVKKFLKLYNIREDELKLESMYRKYQRYAGEKIKVKKKNLVKV
ncbi:hypothetical protein [Flavobacterium columnare]|uniref:hypothetical protein n=1 Tax=Flavobacterium columnare TaxID=996 RepID=UPI0040345046